MNTYISKLMPLSATIIMAALAAAPITAEIAAPTAQPQAEYKVFVPLIAKQTYGPVSLAQWQLAIVNNQAGNKEIYSLTADGANLTRLTNNPADDDRPYWSPSGKTIAFHSGRLVGGEYLLNVGTRTETLLVAPPVKPTVLELTSDTMWVGTDDTFAYFCHTASLCIRKPDGSESKDLYTYPQVTLSDTVGITNGRIVNTVISPDAKHFAHSVIFSGSTISNPTRYAIYVSDAQGANLTAVLPPTTSTTTDFEWSPTGQHLAFVHGRYVMMWSVNSGISKTIASFGSVDGGPDLVQVGGWSPDESSVWVTHNDRMGVSSVNKLCKATLNNSATPLPATCFGEGSGAKVSPDGQWVAYFTANRFDTQIIDGVSTPIVRLWLMRSDGSDKRQFSLNGSITFVSWNPKPLAVTRIR